MYSGDGGGGGTERRRCRMLGKFSRRGDSSSPGSGNGGRSNPQRRATDNGASARRSKRIDFDADSRRVSVRRHVSNQERASV